MKKFLIAITIVLVFTGQAFAQSEIKFKTTPQQRIDVRYRIFDTDNMWTKLLLDSRTGRIWQIAFSVEKEGVRLKLPVNKTPLVNEKDVKDGRFTLYPTDNMWTFILVDQENGNVYQIGFSIDSDGFRGIIPLPEK